MHFPILGVLIPTASLHKAINQPEFRTYWQTQSFLASILGLDLFFMQLPDVNLPKGTTTGYRLEGRELKREIMPIPKVILNTVVLRRMSSRRLVRDMVSRLGVHCFNEANSLRRDLLYQSMQCNPELAGFVMPSAPLDSQVCQEQLRTSVVYLVPLQGALSPNLIQVHPLTTNQVQLQYGRQANQVLHGELQDVIAGFTRKRKYLCCSGPPVIGSPNAPLLFSVPIHNGSDCLPLGVVTRSYSGRRVYRVSELGEVLRPTVVASLVSQVEMLAGRLLWQLIHFVPGLAGGIFSFWLDEHHHPWFIDLELRMGYRWYQNGITRLIWEQWLFSCFQFGKRLLTTGGRQDASHGAFGGS